MLTDLLEKLPEFFDNSSMDKKIKILKMLK